MDIRLDEIKAILKKYQQEHLLNHYEKLDDAHKAVLLSEIENIDFELINHLYNTTKQKEKHTHDEITPIDYLDKYKLNDQYKYYEGIGRKSIKESVIQTKTVKQAEIKQIDDDLKKLKKKQKGLITKETIETINDSFKSILTKYIKSLDAEAVNLSEINSPLDYSKIVKEGGAAEGVAAYTENFANN